jgi:hypothetical protein
MIIGINVIVICTDIGYTFKHNSGIQYTMPMDGWMVSNMSMYTIRLGFRTQSTNVTLLKGTSHTSRSIILITLNTDGHIVVQLNINDVKHDLVDNRRHYGDNTFYDMIVTRTRDSVILQVCCV